MKPRTSPRFVSKTSSDPQSGERSGAAIPAWAEINPKRNVSPASLHVHRVRDGQDIPSRTARLDDAAAVPDRSAPAASPERIEVILSALVERQSGKDKSVQDRRAALEKELKEKDDKLKRLYRAIEDGVIELDGDIGERIKTLKHERDIVKASIERIVEQTKSTAAITPEKIEAFSRLMQNKLENGDIQVRKAYLRAVISTVEVDDHAIRIIGDKSILAAAIAGKQTASENVRGFVRKWRTRHDSNV